MRLTDREMGGSDLIKTRVGIYPFRNVTFYPFFHPIDITAYLIKIRQFYAGGDEIF
jgi:hypothetical protein